MAEKTEVKLYKSSWKAIRILALTIPFIFIGIWLIIKGDSTLRDQVIGWSATCFFGLGLPVGLFQLFDRRPQIIISENGIWDRTMNQDEIKWEQIKGAYLLNIHRQKFISLLLDDNFIIYKKQFKWAKDISEAFGAQQLNLSLGQIKIDEKKMTDFVNRMCQTRHEGRKSIIESYFGY